MHSNLLTQVSGHHQFEDVVILNTHIEEQDEGLQWRRWNVYTKLSKFSVQRNHVFSESSPRFKEFQRPSGLNNSQVDILILQCSLSLSELVLSSKLMIIEALRKDTESLAVRRSQDTVYGTLLSLRALTDGTHKEVLSVY